MELCLTNITFNNKRKCSTTWQICNFKKEQFLNQTSFVYINHCTKLRPSTIQNCHLRILSAEKKRRTTLISIYKQYLRKRTAWNSLHLMGYTLCFIERLIRYKHERRINSKWKRFSVYSLDISFELPFVFVQSFTPGLGLGWFQISLTRRQVSDCSPPGLPVSLSLFCPVLPSWIL